MTPSSAIDRLLGLLHEAVAKRTFVKLTLGSYRGADATMRNVFVRPVRLRGAWHLQFVYRHSTRDIAKNLAVSAGEARVRRLLDGEFGTAHLFTTEHSAQLERRAGQEPRLIMGKPGHEAPADGAHDRARKPLVDPGRPWLQALGITRKDGGVRPDGAAKFRQINRFVEILGHLMAETPLQTNAPLSLMDMGSGKGTLTFAAVDWLRNSGWPAVVARGVEVRTDLVELCNRTATEHGFTGLHFEPGIIAESAVETVDILMALHACDTATDDALAKGIRAGATLLIVAPCCHKELRPQVKAPAVLASALRHGIFLEREAEFATDALRAALLEWAGYSARVFEFVAAEHTAKNLMIVGIKRSPPGDREAAAQSVRDLAAFYGIRRQRLAERLAFPWAEKPE